MEKRVLKIFISFLAVLSFISSVDALGECTAKINATSITSAGFDTNVTICNMVRDGDKFETITSLNNTWVVRHSFDSSSNIGKEQIKTTQESIDGKGFNSVTFSRCDMPGAKIIVSVTCHSYQHVTITNKYDYEICEEGEPNCDCYIIPGVPGNQKHCSKKVITGTTRSCPDGYKDNGYECYKEKIYSDEFDVGSQSESGIKEYVDNIKQSGSWQQCNTPSYSFKCPVYKCDPQEVTIGACTPDFKIGDTTAYCVNPSNGFPSSGGNNYKLDEDFDVNKCANSYSTVDCGYANILIEGTYHKVSDDAINLALRLWGAHSGQSGFNKTGIANVSYNNQSGSCDNTVLFYRPNENGNYNVYKLTHDYIMSKFESYASKQEYITPNGSIIKSVTNEDNIICNQLGVTCGGNNTYKVAIDLFFNTLIGNKYMKEHLNNLYGKASEIPTSATLEPEGEGGAYVLVKYEEIVNITEETEKGKVIYCNNLSEEDEAAFGEFCRNTAIVLKDSKGETIYVKDEEEHVYDQLAMDSCIKGVGCRTIKIKYAVCDETKRTTTIDKIKVYYKPPTSRYSIGKYWACSDPDANQVLFSFFKKDDNPNIITEKTHEDFPVTTYTCVGSCTNYGSRTDLKKNCSYNDNNYNGVYKSTVKDPSLSCILNMVDKVEKSYYDYSQDFGVNTNLCRIYCSDEVEYTLADKVKTNSGFTFEYNIEFQGNKNEDDPKISSVVKMKRTCVSKIYYDEIPDKTYLMTAYGLKSSEVNSIKGWEDLFNVLKSKSAGEAYRKENLNQMVYDLYNCNLYSRSKIEDSKVTVRNNKVEVVIDNIKEKFSASNNYGVKKNCVLGDNNSCVTDSITYYGGAEIINDPINSLDGKYTVKKDSDSKIYRVGTTINSVNIGSMINSYGVSEVSYCSNPDDSNPSREECFTYDKDNESYNYSKGTNETKNVKINSMDVSIPTNDYAIFSFEVDTGFYNSSTYQVTPGEGYINVNNKVSNLSNLDPYLYPMSKQAYSLNECNKESINNSCPVVQRIRVNSFFRNSDNDEFQTSIKENSFTCYVDVEPPKVIPEDPKTPNNSDKSAIYRNVNLSNLFPNDRSYENTNWGTELGIKVKTEIETTADMITSGDALLEYSISLTPEQIQRIREYNKQSGSYMSERIFGCTIDEEAGVYRNCRSEFLDEIRGNNSEYPLGTYATIDSNYSEGTSKYSRGELN